MLKPYLDAVNDTDVRGAECGIIRLQRVYNIKTMDIAKGKLLGRKTSRLSAADRFSMAQVHISIFTK